MPTHVTKRTKMVCTIGPASEELRTIVALGQAGMDVARLNFSHGAYEWHERTLARIRQAGKRLEQPIAVLQDLQGPKIRVGELPKQGLLLKAGAEIVLNTSHAPAPGDIPVTAPDLHRDTRRGMRVLLDDGFMECVVRRVEGRRIHCEVIHGGKLLSHKGVNLPGTKLRVTTLSDKGRADAAWGVSHGVDFMALSFVQSPEDVKQLRAILTKTPAGKRIKLVGKIEKQAAVDRFEEILPLLDVVMIGRGDLGIETDAASVPVVQKQIVSRCREEGVPVIVATQMLDSMQRNPRPTRAEVSDVANAVADHADAVMLSGESASGEYPVESARIMERTIRAMEASKFDDLNALTLTDAAGPELTGLTVRLVSDAVGHAPIVVVSPDGNLARDVVRARPETVIHAVTADATVHRQLRLSWAVMPHLVSAAVLRKPAAILPALVRLRALRRGVRVVVASGERVEIIKT